MASKRIPDKLRVSVEGRVLAEDYQVCKLLAERLHRHHGGRFAAPLVRGHLEADWVGRGDVVTHVDGRLVGGRAELLDRFKEYSWRPPSRETVTELAKREYLGKLTSHDTLYTWMTLRQGSHVLGTLVLQLRADLLPRSCEWFASLCEPVNNTGVSYKGGRVHRVCRGGWLQAGHTTLSDRHCLQDETYAYPHDRPGVLSWANDGRDTNLSQFTISFRSAPWMQGRYVAFGRVVEGCDVLRRVETTPCTYESPDLPITIEDCGIVDVGLGKSVKMASTLPHHGLTVGEPHVSLDIIMDHLLDKFCEVLFNRLDPEIKSRLKGQWIAEMLWDTVGCRLTRRGAPADVLYPQDRSSDTLLVTRYLAGLYGLPDIPDHYLRHLLEAVVEAAVDRSADVDMVRDVVRLLVDTAETVAAESCAEPVVESLLESLLNAVLGPDPLVQIAGSLCDLSSGPEAVSIQERVLRSSSRQSLTLFITDMLFTAIRNATIST